MKNELIHLRVEKELKDKLQKLADADSRKLGDFIRLQLIKIAKITIKKK